MSFLSANWDTDYLASIIEDTYGDTVSIESKKKTLLKFGKRVTVGTGWETLMTVQGTETEETFVSSNTIATVVSSAAGDNGKTLNLEYHTISGSDLTFGVQPVTLDGSDATTPVTLTTACARVSRLYNTSTSALTGTIYVYESGARTDVNTHTVIPIGEQQTQKAATSVSSNDYWIITGFSLSCLAKVSKYVEGRVEIKPVGTSFWRPLSQTISVTDASGTIYVPSDPFLIVPPNSDIRIAVKTNTGSVEVSGGINGYLAIIL